MSPTWPLLTQQCPLLSPHPARFQWCWLRSPEGSGPSNTDLCSGGYYLSLQLCDVRKELQDSGESGPLPTLPSMRALGKPRTSPWCLGL